MKDQPKKLMNYPMKKMIKGTGMRVFTAVIFAGLMGSASAANDLQQCRAMTEPMARLQCYDQYVDAQAPAARHAIAQATPAVASSAAASAVSAAPEVNTAPTNRDESLFGTSGEVIASKIVDLTVTVQSIASDSRQKLLVTMQNGQRWQQLDQGFLKINKGDTCIISSGVFGSYTMKCQQGTKSIRVKRIQ